MAFINFSEKIVWFFIMESVYILCALFSAICVKMSFNVYSSGLPKSHSMNEPPNGNIDLLVRWCACLSPNTILFISLIVSNSRFHLIQLLRYCSYILLLEPLNR